MKVLAPILALLLVASCSTPVEQRPQNHGLEITEVNPNKKTTLVKQNLLHLAQVYDLSPLLFTKKIEVDPKGGTISRAVLTLDTKFAENPNKLLAQFIHGEMHSWLSLHSKRTALAIAELKKIYRQVPKEIRAGDRAGAHAHLLIGYLEIEALKFYLGKKQARAILADFINKDRIFPWVYSQIQKQHFVIKRVIEKHQLLPPPLG